MNKLRVGIVGLGAISSVHIETLLRLENVDIVCVCDKDINKKSILSILGGNVAFFEDYSEMIDKIELDAVHILTPHNLHVPMIIKAIEKGVAVLTEKPAGINTDEIEYVNELIKKYNSKVGIVLQNRLNPATVMAKKYVDNGQFGKLTCLKAILTWNRMGEYYTESEWRGKIEKEGGGLLLNQAIHTLDLLYYLGGEIKNFNGSCHTYKNKGLIEVEDTAQIYIEYMNGGTGIFFGSNCYGVNSPVFIEMIFENGTLVIENDCLYSITTEEKLLLCINNVFDGAHDYWGTSHHMLISRFYESFYNPNVKYIKYEEGIQCAKICFEIYKKSRSSAM